MLAFIFGNLYLLLVAGINWQQLVLYIFPCESGIPTAISCKLPPHHTPSRLFNLLTYRIIGVILDIAAGSMVLSSESSILLLIYKHCNGTEYICTRSTYDVTKFTMTFLHWHASTKPV